MISNPGRRNRVVIYGFEDPHQQEQQDRHLVLLLTQLAEVRYAAGMRVMPVTPGEQLALTRVAALFLPEQEVNVHTVNASLETIWASLPPVTAIRLSTGRMEVRSDDAALQPQSVAQEAERLALRLDLARLEAWKDGAVRAAQGEAGTHNPHLFRHPDQAQQAAQQGWSAGFEFARTADLGNIERDQWRRAVRDLQVQLLETAALPAGVVPEGAWMLADFSAHMKRFAGSPEDPEIPVTDPES